MSSEKLSGTYENRIVEITGEDGWYGVKTMANGDKGYHYMFLG
jgi:hypothetical protein